MEEENGMKHFPVYVDHEADTTPISNIFIDDYMADANEAQLKVYLYLVRMMSEGRSTSISEMADRFNHTEKEIVRSLYYWENKGLLVLQADDSGNLIGIRLCSLQPMPVSVDDHQIISISPLLGEETISNNTEQNDATQEKDLSLISDAKENGTKTAEPSKENLMKFQQQQDSRQLLLIVEQYIGKPLSPSEIRTIYYISEELHFSNELIDYLVEYCVGLGKKDFRYIEKVAVNWAEEGITTTGQAKKAASLKTQKARRAAGKKAKQNAQGFCRFEQKSYDFDQLEEQLLKK